VGVADLTLEPLSIDPDAGPVCVVGGPRSGRSTALAVLAEQAARAGCPVWIFGPTGSPLARWGHPDRTVTGPPAVVADGFDAVTAELARPVGTAELARPVGTAGLARPVGTAGPTGAAPLVLIDDLDLLDDPALDKASARLLAAGPRWAAATVGVRGYTTNVLAQELRRARTVLHLQPAGSREVQEVTGANPSIRPGLALPPGRGVLVVNRHATVIQVAHPDGGGGD
jgi:hypothetical protein